SSDVCSSDLDFGIIEDDGAPIYIGTHTSSVGTAHHVGSPSFAQPGAASGAVPTSGGIGSAGSGPSLGGGGVPTPGPAPSPVQGPTASGPTTGVASPVTAGPGGAASTGSGAGKTPTVLRGGAAATARLTGGTAGLQAGKGAGPRTDGPSWVAGWLTGCLRTRATRCQGSVRRSTTSCSFRSSSTRR